MTRKKILVCGATGFIGRNITETFAKHDNFEVFGVYNKRPYFEHPDITWVKADLTQLEDVNRVVLGKDVIIQAAATTSGSKDIVTRPHIHITDNAVMNSLLFRSAFEHKVNQVVFFSCTVMYPSSDLPLKEEDFDANLAMHPRYFGTSWTKIYLEKMCEFYSQIGKTRYIVIRHSNIYGPHDKFDLEHSHVFGATVTKVMTAKTQGKLIVWGTGEECRDLLYVGDLVDFVKRAIEHQQEAFALYNCGYGKTITIKELVQKIIIAAGKKLVIEHDLSQPTIPTSLCLDCSKAKRELGWQPQTNLDEGIAKTIAWWQSHE
jgi:nucleoside-diphosphate-sugar epimerase